MGVSSHGFFFAFIIIILIIIFMFLGEVSLGANIFCVLRLGGVQCTPPPDRKDRGGSIKKLKHIAFLRQICT